MQSQEGDLLQEHITKHHLKITKEREAILRAFMEAQRHVTAEELHDEMKAKGLAIGIATVYRTLNLFCQCGLAEQRQFGDSHTRYELTYNVTHHDHLICTQCHQIIEFENPDIERLQEDVAARHNFTIYRHKLELYGLCAACNKESARNKRVAPSGGDSPATRVSPLSQYK
jgi:Fur family ferric uptake transcriptional regulator